MRHFSAQPLSYVLIALIALAVGALSCSGVNIDGLGARGADGGPDAPLPRTDGRSLAVWSCSGGGTASNEGSQVVGVTIGGLSGAGAVSAPGGSTVKLGHFVDTVE
jgi:hypothetical protein